MVYFGCQVKYTMDLRVHRFEVGVSSSYESPQVFELDILVENWPAQILIFMIYKLIWT